MSHYVILIVCICIESFVAGFTVILKLSRVQLQVTVQVALRRVPFVTLGAGIFVSAGWMFWRYCRSRPFLILNKNVIYIILFVINRLWIRNCAKYCKENIISLKREPSSALTSTPKYCIEIIVLKRVHRHQIIIVMRTRFSVFEQRFICQSTRDGYQHRKGTCKWNT